MMLDAERAQTTTQSMPPCRSITCPQEQQKDWGEGEELDAKPQPDSHAELLLGYGEAKKRVWKCPQPGPSVRRCNSVQTCLVPQT